MVNDINLAQYTGTQFTIIGRSFSSAFRGVFDGNCHTISHFTYVSIGEDHIGIFGYLRDTAAEIRNVRVMNAVVDAAEGERVGALVGYKLGASMRNCCAEDGTVGGGRSVGGLVGYNSGFIWNCYADMVVMGNDYVGGLSGGGGYVINSYAEGLVSGNENVGGLLGSAGEIMINCYAAAEVLGTTGVGGLAGTGGGVTLNSFWDVDESGQPTSALGVGKSTSEMQMVATFTSWGCDGAWTIDEGRDRPRLSWEGKPGVPITDTGPWEGDGTEYAPYAIKTPQELSAISSVYCAWDKHFRLMADVNAAAANDVVFNPIGICTGGGYPGTCGGLPFTGVFDGNGHSVSNLFIYLPHRNHVGMFGYVYGPHAEIRDLVLVEPEVTAEDDVGALAGFFEGREVTNCRVENATITGTWCVGGVAGQVDSAVVEQCTVAGTVSGGKKVGGIVGAAYGSTVSACLSTGEVNAGSGYAGGVIAYIQDGDIYDSGSTATVSGVEDVGGLIGDSAFGDIVRCFACAKVSGTERVGCLIGSHYKGDLVASYSEGTAHGSACVGGLAGQSHTASVLSCYSHGDINATGYRVGGLVGCSSGTLSNSYSLGAVRGASEVGGLVGYTWGTGSVSYCYFLDPNDGGGPDNGFGEPLTDEEMKQQASFVNWDFNDVWAICEGTNYPRLLWSIPYADIICPDGVTFVDYSYLAERYLWTDYGDVNGVEMTGDGKISAPDFAALANWWGQTSCGDCGGTDFTGEGDVDIDDLAMLCGYWLGTDYGDCEGAELTGDGLVDIDDVKALTDQWLDGI